MGGVLMDPARVHHAHHQERHKARSVSFTLPPKHDEAKEQDTDARVTVARHHSNGDFTVSFEDILITRKDGSKVLITESKAIYLPVDDRSPGHFRYLKLFALVGAIMFFPTGIPSLILAFRAQVIYERTRKCGDLKGRGVRAVRRAERLVTASIALGLLLWGVVFIIAIESMNNNQKTPESMLGHA